ncbi:MAG: phosphatidate cytidylyltransferase [Planctomycetes bacterium]|nr:phosphatidate cytidylyltransferase [Planctomycetota bacterium]
MRKRIAIGLTLVLLVVACVFGDRALGYPLLAGTAIVVMTLRSEHELIRMLRGDRKAGRAAVLAGTGVLFVAVAAVREGWLETQVGLVGGLLVGLFLILLSATFRLQRGPDDETPKLALDLAAGALCLLWLALPMALLLEMALLHPGGQGTLFAGFLVLLSKCGDIGGYLAGTLFGKHRVMPRVSPKKSYEGSLGGFLLTWGLAAAVHAWMPELMPGLNGAEVLLFALLVNLATQAGDFAESMVKRSCGVKDSANLLPTFGGALDIIDSLLLAVPAAWVGFHCWS